jgi:hypothetical protein
MKNLPVESFITGNAPLYSVVRTWPDLRRVPIEHVEIVRSGLYNLGYRFRIRYRGPHRPEHDTLKQDAQAFTVYIRKDVV